MNNTGEFKKCAGCKVEKPPSDFNKNRAERDGLQNYCRVCQAASNKKYNTTGAGRAKHLEAVKRYQQTEKGKESVKRHSTGPKAIESHRRYMNTPKGKAAKARGDRKYRQSEKGKETQRRKSVERAGRHPQKKRARGFVSTAVSSGFLPRASNESCIRCGGEAREYHHYLGYDDRHALDVIPVCLPCHKILDSAQTLLG